MISPDDFKKIDLPAGTIVKSEVFTGALKPALKLWIKPDNDFDTKQSSAQIAFHRRQEFFRRQVGCDVNFPPENSAGFVAEVLVSGFADQSGNVVLTTIKRSVPNGAKLYQT
jgi:tRNA-binding protein